MQNQIYQSDEQSTETPKEMDKYTFKDILIIVIAWLTAFSLLYICYLKIKILHHH